MCLSLVAAALLVFGQTLGHGFVDIDDGAYLFDNPHVVHGLTAEGVAWAFTHTCLCNWHPLTMLSYMLDCQLYGLQPGGHHLTNVLLHAATAILLFLVLRRMTGALWRSALVAAVFVVHPLRAESVAWVAERKDVLSGLFFMLTLGAYVHYVDRPSSWARYSLVVLCYALGLMAKPMLVTLPFVLLLLDYWPLRRRQRIAASGEGSVPRLARPALRSFVGWALPTVTPGRRWAMPTLQGEFARKWWGSLGARPTLRDRPTLRAGEKCRLVVEKIPLFVLSAAVCVVTLRAQDVAMNMVENLSWPLRGANAVVSFVIYLRQMFYPAGLAALYPYPPGGLPLWQVAGATALLVAITATVFVWRRKHRCLAVGWLWYLLMLVPVIGLVQVGRQAMADRYTYLPQIGLYIAVVWAMGDWLSSWRHARWVYGLACPLLIGALMACAWRQTSYWRDAETLWTRALACTSGNEVAHINLGGALVRHRRFKEAIAQYQQALEINPGSEQAYYDMGTVLREQGRLDEAIVQLRQALRINPRNALAENNVGLSFAERGNLDEAIVHYRKAVEIQPELETAHSNLGNVLYLQGGVEEALAAWREALRLNPDHTEILGAAARILATHPDVSVRNGAEAVELGRRAVRLSAASDPMILDTLAAAQAEIGHFADATQTAEQALRVAYAAGDTALAREVQTRLELYRAGTAYHDRRLAGTYRQPLTAQKPGGRPDRY